jgi:hypothetical protein
VVVVVVIGKKVVEVGPIMVEVVIKVVVVIIGKEVVTIITM